MLKADCRRGNMTTATETNEALRKSYFHSCGCSVGPRAAMSTRDTQHQSPPKLRRTAQIKRFRFRPDLPTSSPQKDLSQRHPVNKSNSEFPAQRNLILQRWRARVPWCDRFKATLPVCSAGAAKRLKSAGRETVGRLGLGMDSGNRA